MEIVRVWKGNIDDIIKQMKEEIKNGEKKN